MRFTLLEQRGQPSGLFPDRRIPIGFRPRYRLDLAAVGKIPAPGSCPVLARRGAVALPALRLHVDAAGLGGPGWRWFSVSGSDSDARSYIRRKAPKRLISRGENMDYKVKDLQLADWGR